MFLPTTYVAALLLTLLSMFCWGSWANTQKLTGKWRFELYYFDYAFGVLLCAILAAITFGSLNSHELGIMDTIALTAKRKMVWAFAGGVVFNLANMLLVAAISIAGLAVAFPVGIGLALVIGVVWNYRLNPQGNPALLFGGAALVVMAIIVDAVAYKTHAASLRKLKGAEVPAPAPAAEKFGRQRSSRSSSSRSPSSSAPGPTKGIVISLISGVLMGSFYPLVQIARSGEDGVQPYADALLFAAGVFLSTFLFNFFFMMMPVEGNPVSLPDFFRGTKWQHLLGVAGGLIWCVGAISNFVASSAPPQVQVGPAVSYAMGQGATMVSALWGLLVWKEFAGAIPRVRLLLAVMLVLFAAGLLMVSIAPLYAN
jgi:glucose uptake protein